MSDIDELKGERIVPPPPVVPPVRTAAKGERQFRVALTFAELEAAAWAVWFAHPAARSEDAPALSTLSEKLLARRRGARTAGPSEEALVGRNVGFHTAHLLHDGRRPATPAAGDRRRDAPLPLRSLR